MEMIRSIVQANSCNKRYAGECFRSVGACGGRAEKKTLRKMRQAHDPMTMKADMQVEWSIEVMRESAYSRPASLCKSTAIESDACIHEKSERGHVYDRIRENIEKHSKM